MLAPIDEFPFNVPAGTEFLRFYLLLSAAVLVLSWMIRGAVRDRLDQPQRASPSAPARDSYRGGQAPAGQLEIGRIPGYEDVPALAYLFGGEGRVADTLIADAFLEGWLSPELTIVASPQDAAQRQLHERLAAHGGEKLSYGQIQSAARAVAARMSPALRATLERDGLLRTNATRFTLRVIVVGAGALLIAVAVLRIAARSALPGPVPFPLWLLLAMLAVGAVTVWMARRDELPRATAAYRSWLESASHSLLIDVHSGRRRAPDDIGLAVAISGIAVLMAHPELAIYAAEAHAHAAALAWSTTNTANSCGGSTSTSTSCGGGGSCGGGCGGGGGCS